MVPGPSTRPWRAALLLVLVLALGLRLHGLLVCWPYLKAVDEGHLTGPVAHAVRTGDLDPDWFNWGPLPHLITTAAVEGTRQVAGWLGTPVARSEFLSSRETGRYGTVEPPLVVTVARLASVLAGVATVAWLAFAAARLAGAAWAGVLAAAWLAVSALHVEHSQYVAPDVWTALFTAVALGLLCAAGSRMGVGRVAAVGAVVGLAAACKSSLGSLLVLPAVMVLVDRERSLRTRVAWLLTCGAAASASYVAACPWSVTRFERWYGSLVFVRLAYASKVATGIAAPHWQYARALLGSGFGWLGTGLALAGLVAALRSDRAVVRRLAAASLAWLALYLGVLSSQEFQPLRQLTPVLVVLAAWAAWAVARGAAWGAARGRARLAAVGAWSVAALLVLPPLDASIAWADREAARRDTRNELLDWVASRAGGAASVGVAPALDLSRHALGVRRLAAVPIGEVLAGRAPEPRFAVSCRWRESVPRTEEQEAWLAADRWLAEHYRVVQRWGNKPAASHRAFFTPNEVEVLAWERGREAPAEEPGVAPAGR